MHISFFLLFAFYYYTICLFRMILNFTYYKSFLYLLQFIYKKVVLLHIISQQIKK